MISRDIFRKSLLFSFVASCAEVMAMLILLWLITDLGLGHLVKAGPALLFNAVFVIGFEAIFFYRWLKQTRIFDEMVQNNAGSDELGPQALLAQEELVKFPIRVPFLVMVLWFFCGIFLLIDMLFPAGEIFFVWEAVFVLIVSVLGGFLALVFHFYICRRIIWMNAGKILEYETGYHLSQAETGFLNLTKKIRLSFIPVIFSGLAALVALGFFQTSAVVQKSYIQELTRMQKVFQDSHLTLEQIQSELNDTAKLLGVNLFLFDSQGRDPITGYDQGLSGSLVRKIQARSGKTFSLRYNSRLSLFVTEVSEYNNQPVFLAMVYDWDKFFSLGYRMVAIMGMVALVILGIGFYISSLMSYDLSDPLSKMMEQTERVSKGDLSVDFNIISNDELGVLAGRLKGMTLNLRELIMRVSDSYEQVRRVISDILQSSDTVARGAEEQIQAVEAASHNIREVNRAIKEVSDNVEILHRSGTETTERAEKMIHLVEEMGRSIEELSKSVELSGSSIYEMSSAIKQIAQNADELNSRSAETSRAVKKMEASITEVSGISQQNREIFERMKQGAEQGVKAVQETIKGISAIEDTVSQAKGVLENLGQGATQIERILKVIREVANRTNLLALNAAIIAAQAGEQGQGFAVVADEIKSLADRVANSTVEIEQIIKQVQEGTRKVISVMGKSYEQVEAGVNLSYEAGEALERIMKSVEQSLGGAGKISQAMDQQVESVQIATKEMGTIADLINQIAVSTREQSKGVDMVLKASEEIKQVNQMVLSRSQIQNEEARRVQVAMENVEQMIKFILNTQRAQALTSEKIVEAVNRVKSIAERNAHSVSDLDKNIGVLNQQSEVLKGVLNQFQIHISADDKENEN